MDFDLKDQDKLLNESFIITYTNIQMHFKTLSEKYDTNLIPESFNTTIPELNKVIRELNKTTYRVFNKFRLKENEDFMASPLAWMSHLFPFIGICCVVTYIIMNINYENAR